MTTPLTPLARELLAGPNFAVVATTGPDGTVMQSVVWVREQDGEPVFSTVEGRVKHRHLLADPRVSLLVIDAADGYRYSAIRGTARIEHQDADELIAELSLKYTGEPWVETQTRPRVVVVITPERISDYAD